MNQKALLTMDKPTFIVGKIQKTQLSRAKELKKQHKIFQDQLQQAVFQLDVQLNHIETSCLINNIDIQEEPDMMSLTSYASTLKQVDDYKPEPYEYLYKPWSYKNTEGQWIQLLDDTSILIQMKLLNYEYILTKYFHNKPSGIPGMPDQYKSQRTIPNRNKIEYWFELEYKKEKLYIEFDYQMHSLI